MKRCSRCKEDKPFGGFYKSKATHDGLHPQCKDCKKKSDRRAYLKNRYEKTKRQREWYAKNAESEREKAKIRYQKRIGNPITREEIAKRKREWAKDRAKIDPSFRIRKTMSREVGRGLKKGWRSWEKWVDYNLEDLLRHLERQFIGGMSFDNYGSVWHIDHIVPVSSFDICEIGDKEFMACWALSNLRPLPVAENLKKHSKRTHLL